MREIIGGEPKDPRTLPRCFEVEQARAREPAVDGLMISPYQGYAALAFLGRPWAEGGSRWIWAILLGWMPYHNTDSQLSTAYERHSERIAAPEKGDVTKKAGEGKRSRSHVNARERLAASRPVHCWHRGRCPCYRKEAAAMKQGSFTGLWERMHCNVESKTGNCTAHWSVQHSIVRGPSMPLNARRLAMTEAPGTRCPVDRELPVAAGCRWLLLREGVSPDHPNRLASGSSSVLPVVFLVRGGFWICGLWLAAASWPSETPEWES